jgi:hypothetical protein
MPWTIRSCLVNSRLGVRVPRQLLKPQVNGLQTGLCWPRPAHRPQVANYRGAIERYILPSLGRAKIHEVDAATLDILYAQVRATGGKCRVCWKRIRRGEPACALGCATGPAPLRYVGAARLPPGPGSDAGGGNAVENVGARRAVDRGRHDLCGFAVIPTLRREQFSHSPRG